MKHVLWTEWSTWNVEKRGHRWKKRYIGQILFCTHITLWCSKFETKTSSKNGNNIVMHFIHSFFKCSHFCAIISICMINFKLIWLQAKKSAACAKYAKPMQGVDYKNGGKTTKTVLRKFEIFRGYEENLWDLFLAGIDHTLVYTSWKISVRKHRFYPQTLMWMKWLSKAFICRMYGEHHFHLALLMMLATTKNMVRFFYTLFFFHHLYANVVQW